MSATQLRALAGTSPLRRRRLGPHVTITRPRPSPTAGESLLASSTRTPGPNSSPTPDADEVQGASSPGVPRRWRSAGWAPGRARRSEAPDRVRRFARRIPRHRDCRWPEAEDGPGEPRRDSRRRALPVGRNFWNPVLVQVSRVCPGSAHWRTSAPWGTALANAVAFSHAACAGEQAGYVEPRPCCRSRARPWSFGNSQSCAISHPSSSDGAQWAYFWLVPRSRDNRRLDNEGSGIFRCTGRVSASRGRPLVGA